MTVRKSRRLPSPSWKLLVGLNPFVAAAVAINLFLLFLMLHAVGVTMLAPLTAVLWAITRDGVREVLGLWIAENEGAKFWLSVMNELKNRGVQDVLIAVVDGLKGFPDAIRPPSQRSLSRPASSTWCAIP